MTSWPHGANNLFEAPPRGMRCPELKQNAGAEENSGAPANYIATSCKLNGRQ